VVVEPELGTQDHDRPANALGSPRGRSPRTSPTSSKGSGRGTGMGLPFCRRVLKSFGGDIQCRSREGEYTELELTFPRVEE